MKALRGLWTSLSRTFVAVGRVELDGLRGSPGDVAVRPATGRLGLRTSRRLLVGSLWDAALSDSSTGSGLGGTAGYWALPVWPSWPAERYWFGEPWNTPIVSSCDRGFSSGRGVGSTGWVDPSAAFNRPYCVCQQYRFRAAIGSKAAGFGRIIWDGRSEDAFFVRTELVSSIRPVPSGLVGMGLPSRRAWSQSAGPCGGCSRGSVSHAPRQRRHRSGR